jgi:transketolase
MRRDAVSPQLDELCINTLRTLAMDAVQRANSGHPGAPMGMAPMAYVLWSRHLRHNPANPQWAARDRFVLSAGHASMLLYGLLHLTGYDLTLDDLKAFRQWGSRTPGHPEHGLTPGVETTTGPLGQGLGTAVGMAMAQAHLAAVYHRPGHDVLQHYTYVLASDGDLMEGISHESASLAGHLKLGRLVVLYDDNRITIDGATSLSWSDDVAQRFGAYQWQVLTVEDGNDLAAIDAALTDAKADATRPTLIRVRTHIGYGSPNKQDSEASHGAPLGEDEIALTKANLQWPHSEPFAVPDEALAVWRDALAQGAAAEAEWDERFAGYASAFPAEATELERRLEGRLPDGWEAALPDLAGSGGMATRQASGKVVTALATAVPDLLGGSADLSGSNNTTMKGQPNVEPDALGGRNVFYGVREHAMGAAMNGMALYGGIVPFGGTFLVFSDYMRPAIRLAALMEQKVVYVFTHDSVGLGEDGPTHQPVEMLSALRAIPNLLVIRPSDARETVEAWRVALRHEGGPVALVLTRQKVPDLPEGTASVAHGAYVVADASNGAPRVVIVGSGSETSVAVEAREMLEQDGVPARVVSMPSMELFAQQPDAYRASVLPPGVPRVAVEAAHPQSWHRWVGDTGAIVGIDRFGASAPASRVFAEYGITAEAVTARVRGLLDG